MSLGAVDAFSACLRKRAPACAVELLEQGRGIFWSQLTRLRSPLDGLIGSGPGGKTLADEFTRLASLICNALNSPGADQHERVCHLNCELQRVMTDIRKLSGLSRFLLPLLFSDLQHAASRGPVVIVNVSEYSRVGQLGSRSYSVADHTGRDSRAMTVRAQRDDMTRDLVSFLRKLWDQIVSPIVDRLQMTHPSQPRT